MKKSELRQIIREEISNIDALDKFEQMLRSHDWYYMMSDDPSVYRKGEKRWKELEDMALLLAGITTAQELWDKYAKDIPYSTWKFPYPKEK